MPNQEVGSAFVSIFPKMTNDWGGIGSKAAAKFSGGFSAGISAAAVAAGNLISNGISKALSAVSSGIGAGIGRSDILSGFPKVMEQMGFEADIAQSSISRIADALDGLPTATQELVPFVQGLVAINGNLDKSTDIGIAFNDMLVASGANTATAANAQEMFSKMLASGVYNEQRWISLTEAMPGTLGMVAQSMLGTGKNAADLGKALDSGAISFDQLTAAMIELDKTGAGGLASFHDQALAAAGGIGTAITNVSNRIGAGIAAILDKFGNANIAGVIDTFSYSLKGVFVSFANAIEPFAKSVNWEGIKSVITSFFAAIGNAISGFVSNPAVSAVGGIIMRIAGAFGSFGSQVGTMLESGFAKAQSVIGGIVGGLSNFIDGLGMTADVTPLLEAIGNHFNTLAEMAQRFLYGTDWASAGATIGGVLTTIAQMAGSVVNAITDFAQGFISGFNAIIEYLPVDFILDALNNIQQAFQQIADSGVIEAIGFVVGTVFGTVVTGVLTIVAGIINGLAYEFEHFGEQVAFVVEFVNGLIDSMYAAIDGFVQGVLTAIAQFAADLWNGINELTTNIYNTVQGGLDAVFQFVSQIWDNIVNTISTAVSSAYNVVVNAFNLVRNAVSSALDAVFSTVSRIWNSIVSAVSGAVNAVSSTVSSVFEGVSSTVSGIFEGIRSTAETVWNGIKSAIEGPINAARDIVEGAINAIRGFFDFKFEWPHIPVPEFTISGSINPLDWISQGPPKIGLEWHAKGGYFDGATLIGVGEAGGELLLPKSGGLMDPFAETVASKVESDDADRVIAWLDENLPYIIEHFTPTISRRDFDRMARRATA